jgi:hypothetical protein
LKEAQHYISSLPSEAAALSSRYPIPVESTTYLPIRELSHDQGDRKKEAGWNIEAEAA